MGQTPRQRLTQLPMPTRSTEASSECFGRVVLTYLREDEQKPASFFILGDVLHRTIQDTINHDLSKDDALELVQEFIWFELDKVRGQEIIESAERGVESMPEDARRMIHNWFTYVHPDSKKRHPVYDEYEWPPATEVPFNLSTKMAGTRYPVWGSVDAIFSRKDVGDGGPLDMIVDWKSGVKRPDDDFQLQYYRFGMGLENVPAHFHMLDRVRKPSIVIEADPYPGDVFIKEAISQVERQKEAVLLGSVPRFRPDWYCDYCPVQHLCPADGDFRNRKKNGKVLKKLLKDVEPMDEIDHDVQLITLS